MVRNRRLARAILDMGFYEFRRQLDYKTELRRGHVVAVDRWFPSSKLCSNCNVIKDELLLGERMFRCEACGHELDRDHNAAINIARAVLDPFSTVSSTEFEACGEESSGLHFVVGETGLAEAGTGT